MKEMAPWPVLLGLSALLLGHVFATVTSGARGTGSMHAHDFKHCMRTALQPSLGVCAGRTALSFLQRFDEHNNYTLLDEFVSRKDEKVAGRSLVNLLDADPVDFRGILENAGAVFSQRSLEWHLDRLYPGLMFKIGPTADKNSVAEFVLDPSAIERQFGFEEPSTARLLAKQYLLPFLLGLKFNLVALVPLLFAGICLLLKKALFFAKLAIYVSSFLGIGGAVGAISSLGGLGSLAGGLSGGLGGLGGLGGFGGLGGGGGGFAQNGAPFHAQPHAPAGGLAAGPAGTGYFPGKTTVLEHYGNADELHHNGPYRRGERKLHLKFEEPRDVPPTVPDHFYDYEQQSRRRTAKGTLAPYDSAGWQTVDVRES